MPSATEGGSRRRNRADPAMRGPRIAVPNTPPSSTMARAAAPKRPRGALTTPVEATSASPPRTIATAARSHDLSITIVASAEPDGTR